MAAKRPLDLCLVNPGRTQGYQSLGRSLAAIEPPIWAGLIATFVRKRGFGVAIVDAHAEDLGPDETAERIGAMDPLLTVIVVSGHNPSASTSVMPAAGAIARAVKSRNPRLATCFTGVHVAALPERTLREEAVDFVCGGEGPVTVRELLEALGAAGPGSVEGVRGLWRRDGEAIRSNAPAPLVQDLDGEMPGIAWDLLPMQRYRAHNWHCFGGLSREPYAALYTTLGCPYRCSFCCIHSIFRAGEEKAGRKESPSSYRFWSPASVIAEIDKLVRDHGVRNLKLADEIFVLNPSHVLGIADLIVERGYDLNLWAYARVDTVREGMIERLARAGVRWLAFGIESASGRVLEDVRKGYREEAVFRTIRKVREAGVHVIGNFMFGLPEDDLETMQATLDLACALDCEFVNFNCCMAYPGSPLHDVALEKGWPLPAAWSGYSQYSADTLPLPTKFLPAAEVLRFRDHAFQVYFGRPAYRERIAREFGPETAREIEEMASHKLERKHA